MKPETKYQTPKAIDLEEAVLGALMIDVKAADEVMQILKTSDCFYKPQHQKIYVAIQDLYTKGQSIDLLTVSKRLREFGTLDEVGGDYFLIQLTKKVSSSAHAEYHSRIVLQQYLKRSIVMFNSQISALAYDESTDVVELIDRWQKEFDKVAEITSGGRKTVSFSDALEHLKEEVQHLSSHSDDSPLVGVDTGFLRTNRYTGGYRKQDLVIIAARPGMGKTSKVLKTAVENVKNGVPVGVVSLEMSVHQLTARAVAIDTNFHLKQLLKTGFEKQEYFTTYSAHQNRMKGYPLFIDDSGNNDITDIVMQAKLWKRTYGIELLIIDYLQLMGDRTVKGNREAEISSISRRLKRLAKELDIPVIALSQLSRSVETRGGSKRPVLSDLRDSGAIEQDADIVEFIYRPDYYGIEIQEEDYDSAAQKHCVQLGANAEIIFAKYRGGSVGTALLKWVGDKTKFIDVEDHNDTAEYIDNKVPVGSLDEAFGDDDNPFV
ncbi:replicative DNA helicase [Galbibacter sp. BG1]|uniref:replicative DNA helicase n=1 Tax=Galbibacter sp. BG1 TaxID=1170699 RepID=UPI0015C0AB85|nr:replicative DNA helicase [Galbibacter sp. BG1]QLE02900.1 replicative DNA helicase [Galbibacter sp. BG1]